MERGRLIIEDGFANEGLRRRMALSRGTCTLQRIVVVGRTGLVTLDALRWLADLGIALLFVGVGGQLTSVFTPTPYKEVPVAERHRYEQIGHAATQLRALYDERISRPWHLDDIAETERAGCQIYWAALSGIPLRWKPRAAARVPEHWLTTNRGSLFGLVTAMEPPIRQTRYSITVTHCWKQKRALDATILGFTQV